MDSKSIKIAELLSGSNLESKGRVFLTGVEERVKDSILIIESEYSQKDLLRHCIEFADHDLVEAMKADVNDLVRVGFFPITEVENELDHAIKHSLIGSYKAAYSDLRRALEMAVILIFLTSHHQKKQEAIDWVKSQKDSPFFTPMLKKLVSSGRFADINTQCDWLGKMQTLYWKLSDIAHTKGYQYSYNSLNKPNFFIPGGFLPSTYKDSLFDFLNKYIETVGHIAVLLVLYNPILIVGLPVYEKFGHLSGPFSGFYKESQVELLTKVIPSEYFDFLETLKTNDEEIQAILEWVRNHPDMTEEDYRREIDEIDSISNGDDK